MLKNLTARLRKRVNRDWHRFRFQQVVSGVHRLPPLHRGRAPLTLLSMVQPRDVAPYLLALRSFYRFVPAHRVVVVCDPKMGPGEIATIHRAVPFVEFLKAETFQEADFPVGGTWERLAAIARLSQEDYVVQMDADTVSLLPPTEVLQAVESGRSFLIGEKPRQQVVSCEEASAAASEFLSRVAARHIQACSEREIVNAAPPGSLYTRGCSGFTGFPRNAGALESMRAFSRAMQSRLGDRWAEWGTEQVTSNFLAANLPGAFVLPFPAYATPDVRTPQTKFLHFIGSLRFESEVYALTARNVMAELARH